MRQIYLTIVLLISILCTMSGQVQDTLNQDATPIGGVNTLAVRYYGIDFTKAQRLLLEDKEIEFIFQIDENGKPTLSEVNGINDAAIIDSLQQRTLTIAPFYPRIRNGIAEPSIYFMQLIFPTYKKAPGHFGLSNGIGYRRWKLDDFEYINTGRQRFDMNIGGMVNQFVGRPARHLGTGGGMKIDLIFTGKRDLLYGLNMSFYGNKLNMEYPLVTNREQFSAPPTLLVGAIFGKWFNKFNVQSEINLAIQNITERIGDIDPDWIQLRGWSPGVVVNYPIQLGKGKPVYYYGSPTLFTHNLNFHFGLRYLFLSIPEASGTMLELGVSYRMTLKNITAYELK